MLVLYFLFSHSLHKGRQSNKRGGWQLLLYLLGAQVTLTAWRASPGAQRGQLLLCSHPTDHSDGTDGEETAPALDNFSHIYASVLPGDKCYIIASCDPFLFFNKTDEESLRDYGVLIKIQAA